MKMLITYVICIPLAVLVGYLLTNPLDYGTLGFLGLILGLIISPIFIKWHFPILVFALSSPIVVCFLKTSPSFSQVMIFLSLGIAIIERTLSSERRFISVPSITWPLMFTLVVVIFTAELTGGIGFHSLGGDSGVVGGGKKYLFIFTGIAGFFALSSRAIAPRRRWLYVGLFFLPVMLSVVSDLFPYLPSPLNYINLLIPSSSYNMDSSSVSDMGQKLKRFSGLSTLAGALCAFMLARYGFKGIIAGGKPWRLALLLLFCFFTLAGGFRSGILNLGLTFTLLFFMEGLHRTRLMPVVIMLLVSLCVLIIPFAGKLPTPMQRSLAFLPLSNLDPVVVMDAESSSEWRFRMWSFLWPQVPNYLLLGKGFGLTKEDFTVMGQDSALATSAERFDASSAGLAVSSDFHNGPLSTLIPFGVWGGVAFLWLSIAGLRLHYRNYKYGDPELKIVNRYLLVCMVVHLLGFFFIFGHFPDNLFFIATHCGFSVALNGGMHGPAAEPAFNPRIKPLAAPQVA